MVDDLVGGGWHRHESMQSLLRQFAEHLMVVL
jgi:hypothetical protein